MIPFRRYAKGQDVLCSLCGKIVGKAEDGFIMGFGEGNGNRELACIGKCELKETRKTWYDTASSVSAAEKYNSEHEEVLAQMREINLEVFAKKGSKVAAALLDEGQSQNAFEDI